MKLVVIESPYSGDIKRNILYLKLCLRHSLSLGEAPFASHLFYTQFLNDDNPEERKLGMDAGFAWQARADLVAVYTDLGISKGMNEGIFSATRYGIPVTLRSLKDANLG